MINTINAGKASTKPKVPAPTTPGAGGGSFMSRIANRLNTSVNTANAVPATAPTPAPAPAPLTPQEQQAALVPGYDNRALSKLNEIGLSDGPSPWMKLAEEKQRADEATQLDMTAKQGAGAMAEARDSLAMRGGLSGGAAENLAMRNMDNTLLGQQSVRGQGVTQRLGLGMDDANRKLGILQNLPGQNLNIWSEGMKAKGAQAMADAIREAGKGGPIQQAMNDPGQAAVNALPRGEGQEAGKIWNKITTFNPALDPTGGFVSGMNAVKTVKAPKWLMG